VHDRGTKHGETFPRERYAESPPEHLAYPGAPDLGYLLTM
jgi:hypothetical protein